MYWLLDPATQAKIRADITALTIGLSTIVGSTQEDQTFPFAGRKDRRKALEVIRHLSGGEDLVIDPFSGSGTFSYAGTELRRTVRAGEWEPFAHRLSTAPWRVPAGADVVAALAAIENGVGAALRELYAIVCVCGNPHVLDSQFFDRVPLRYTGVTAHERLGANGETITYRQSAKCPTCGATEKFFDATDQAHLDDVESRPVPAAYAALFSRDLIPNSRINLSGAMTVYGNLFPHRSKLALAYLWNAIQALSTTDATRGALEDAFLAIIPQAKFKDYRGKSQDIHPPENRLREVNIYTRFLDSVRTRLSRLRAYGFSGAAPIENVDFRDLLTSTPVGSAQLVFTDPPWTDGVAYFEKAQLYQPWLGFDLAHDGARLAGEVIVTDAPSRVDKHGLDQWWDDIAELFEAAGKATRDLGYLALFFRPIPAPKWLENLNRLKLIARRAGYEPLLSIDVTSPDPAMRIQQSAAYVFAGDIIFVFVRLPEPVRRRFIGDVELDHLAFRAAANLQQRAMGPFSFGEWTVEMGRLVIEAGVPVLNLPAQDPLRRELFHRYTAPVEGRPGLVLTDAEAPFAGQLFDIPAVERLFRYVPLVIDDLLSASPTFTYEQFLLRLAEFVENGTRSLILQTQGVNPVELLAPYVESDGGHNFRRRVRPNLPNGVSEIHDLEPTQFEHFCAELLELQGFTDVAVMGRSGDRGLDIAARDPQGRMVVVQCKRYLGNVGSDPIQRLHSFSVTRNADRRIFITTSGYTPDGRDEAARTDTELIDGTELEHLVAEFMPDFLVRP